VSDDPEFDFEGDDETPADDLVVDKRGLARATGCNLYEVEKFIKLGLPVAGKKGNALQFSIPDCVQFMLRRDDDQDRQLARRKELAIVQKREAEAAKIGGKSVSLDMVRAAIRDGVAKLQAELESIPAKCPPDTRELVRIEITDAINRLADGVAQ